MAAACLYRRILGERFDALPAVLRQFHDCPDGGRARGAMCIKRGTGWLRNAVAAVLGMPRSGIDVPVSLRVVVEGDRERWIRQFGGQRLETVQWASSGLLMEAYGLTSFASAVIVDGSCLRYQFQRAWFGGIAVPRKLSPYVEGDARAGETGWRVGVHMAAPVLGWLIHYEGWMEPE